MGDLSGVCDQREVTRGLFLSVESIVKGVCVRQDKMRRSCSRREEESLESGLTVGGLEYCRAGVDHVFGVILWIVDNVSTPIIKLIGLWSWDITDDVIILR